MSIQNVRVAQTLCGSLWPEDGIPFHRSGRRRGARGRKLAALCKQIERTVTQVLAGYIGDSKLYDVTVYSVLPAPDASCMHVMVSSGSIESRTEAKDMEQRLNALLSLFREHVARDINRKRVPNFVFRVIRVAKDGQT